jgi:uncharacterized protein YjbI with pentapeptide repeats
MANEEHLARLKQGYEAWKQWRDEHLEIHPDLAKANLIRASLSRANLREANLDFRLSFNGLYLRRWTLAPLEDSRPYGMKVLRPSASIRSISRTGTSPRSSFEGLAYPMT